MSFITTIQGGGADIMMQGVTARNRALPGDKVVVQLLPKSKWKVGRSIGHVGQFKDVML